MPTDTISTIVSYLESGGTSITTLAGVAGTGKTYYALRAAEQFTGSALLVRTVQFHPSYSYEDLMEGLRPNPTGGFELTQGMLLDWNTQASSDPENRYVFLIDELTRADVAAVLGEVFTYIEYRDRHFSLPISKRTVRLAPNLFFLATMNPQDKSALELDDALIRRMTIIAMPPSVSELRSMLESSLAELSPDDRQSIVNPLVGMFNACRASFDSSFEQLMPFGHAIFAGVRNADDLTRLWRGRIRFLLERGSHLPPHPFRDVISANYPWKE